MGATVFLNSLHHLSEAAEGGCQYPVVIRVSKHSMKIIVDPASRLSASEEFEEVIDIEAIENTTENCPLADSIA